jgi:hypothetical protein
MRCPARSLRKTVSCASVLAGLTACSVYEPKLLDDAAAAVNAAGSGQGGTEPSIIPGEGGAGNHVGGSRAPTGGSDPDEPGAGGLGEETGGSSIAGTNNEPGAGTGTTTGSGGSSGGAPVGLPEGLLDGFEDEDLTLEPRDGRSGVWYLFDDGTVGEAGPTPLACDTLVSAPEALGSFAMHVTATGFTGWGSGLGVDFRAGKKPYDGGTLSGVRFWARVGEGKNTRHRVQLVDSTTDKLGGKCNAAADAIDGEKCDDHFGKNLIFTTTWEPYVLKFSELSQIGWGKSAPALDKTTLYGLQVTAKAKLDVDLWLDQIEFF